MQLKKVVPLETYVFLVAFCVYNGVPYKQGESWKVGCEKICRCDDAMNSQINCDERYVHVSKS